jgi:DNA polymerase-3 subunit chi
VTEVAFHFGVPEKLRYTARLIRKAVGSGAKVAVLSKAQQQQQLDAALWSLSAIDFLAHCAPGAGLLMEELSPVLLLTALNGVASHHTVLVNLLQTVPQGFERYERVIEIVSNDDDDRHMARERWKQYTQAGFLIKRHDLTPRGTDA